MIVIGLGKRVRTVKWQDFKKKREGNKMENNAM